MKVSVVIPAYNEEKYLQQTLTAVCALSYTDLEIIVVDNASTDTTAAVARQFPKVKVVTETRKGTQYARERGRKEATGEIIASIDADCLPSPDWLQKTIHLFANEKLVAVSGPYDYYDAPPLFKFSSKILQKNIYVLFNIILQFFQIGGILIAGNALIRSSTLEKMNGYDTSFIFYGDDTDTAKRLTHYGKIIFTSKLTMKTSARRFRQQGVVKTFTLYLFYFLKTIFFRKNLEK